MTDSSIQIFIEHLPLKRLSAKNGKGVANNQTSYFSVEPGTSGEREATTIRQAWESVVSSQTVKPAVRGTEQTCSGQCGLHAAPLSFFPPSLPSTPSAKDRAWRLGRVWRSSIWSEENDTEARDTGAQERGANPEILGEIENGKYFQRISKLSSSKTSFL